MAGPQRVQSVGVRAAVLALAPSLTAVTSGITTGTTVPRKSGKCGRIWRAARRSRLWAPSIVIDYKRAQPGPFAMATVPADAILGRPLG